MRLDRERGLLHCDYCRSEAMPPVGEDGVQILGGTAYSCPHCAAKLSDGLMERRPLLFCESCRGMLISMEHFLPLVEHLRALRAAPAPFLAPRGDHDAGRDLNCPLCRQSMHNHPYGGGGNVHIESCERCSAIWLDRAELQRIVVAPDPRPVYSNYDAGGFDRSE
jgi:Zn-finger nucleic acid-binding protein